MTEAFFHPEAVAEARAAHDWYLERSENAAGAFLVALDDAIVDIITAPDRWPEYVAGTRRYLLKRFPFLVIYRLHDGDIHVVAVAHGHRRPGYWKAR